MKSFLITSALLIFVEVFVFGQSIDKINLIKINGFTRNEEAACIPNVRIFSLILRNEAASDNNGAYSIMSTPEDTLIFTTPGYKPVLLTVPQEFIVTDYTAEVIIVRDTLVIQEVFVLPWPTYNEFRNAATKVKPVTFEMANLSFNVALVRQQLYYNLEATPGEGYRLTIQQIGYDCYTKGQLH